MESGDELDGKAAEHLLNSVSMLINWSLGCIPVRLIRCLTTPCFTSLCILFSLPSAHCWVGLTLKGNYTSFETVPRAPITIAMTLNVRQLKNRVISYLRSQ